MLLELVAPCGPELARRWLAALMLVPTDERGAVVSAIEARLTRAYSGTSLLSEPTLRRVVHPAVQRDGYVEQIVRSYEQVGVLPRAEAEIEDKPERGAGGGGGAGGREARSA